MCFSRSQRHGIAVVHFRSARIWRCWYGSVNGVPGQPRPVVACSSTAAVSLWCIPLDVTVFLQASCPAACSGRGSCVAGACICLPGWSSADCSVASCDTCPEHSTCDPQGFCRCHIGWLDDQCDRAATCSGVSNCTHPSQGRMARLTASICSVA
jgi:hypothetical protein